VDDGPVVVERIGAVCRITLNRPARHNPLSARCIRDLVGAVTAAEADGYLRAHLAAAGRSDTLFSDDAVRAIHTHARGMPRAINRLAVNALLAAYTAGKTIADESAARTAIAEDTATD